MVHQMTRWSLGPQRVHSLGICSRILAWVQRSCAIEKSGAKAWPLAAFGAEPVINDEIGFSPVVLIGDPATETVRAYGRGEARFSGDAATVMGPGGSGA